MFMPIDEDKARQVHAASLSHVFTKTLRRYNDFVSSCNSDDAKEYAMHQNACKAALAHMDSLMKLMASLDMQPDHEMLDAGVQDAAMLEDLLANARHEINQNLRTLQPYKQEE